MPEAGSASSEPWAPAVDGAEGRIVVAGEALVDDLPAARPGGARRLLPGGAPVNVAVGVARLGAPATFAGPIGDDEGGDLLRAHLAAAGVALATAVVAAPSARAVVEVDADGRPAYAFELEGSACRRLAVEPRHVAGAAAIAVVGGAVAFDDEPLGPSLARLLDGAAAPCWLDPNVRTGAVGDDWPGRFRYRRLVESLVAGADLVKASDEDVALLHGPDVDPVVVARAWAGMGPAVVVLTRGAEGLVALRRGGGTIEVPAAGVPSASGRTGPGDTVGAGDAVTAALLAWAHQRGALAAGDLAALGDAELRAGLVLATRAAAVTASRPGADPPTRAELDELVDDRDD